MLYVAVTWRTTDTTTQKVQAFINSCLRRILRIHLPKTISNKDLWQQTGSAPIELDINKRRWKWIVYSEEADQQCHKTSLEMELTGKKEEGAGSGLSWQLIERIRLDGVILFVTYAPLGTLCDIIVKCDNGELSLCEFILESDNAVMWHDNPVTYHYYVTISPPYDLSLECDIVDVSIFMWHGVVARQSPTCDQLQ